MKRMYRNGIALTLCALCLASTASATVDLDNTVFQSDPAVTQVQPPLQPTTQWGQLTWIDQDSFLLENQSLNTTQVFHTQETHFVDAVSGKTLDTATLQDGATVYVYASPATTMSIPPQSSALVVIGNIPMDFGVPSYYVIDGTVVVEKDGISLYNGEDEFRIPNDVALELFDTEDTTTWQALSAGSGVLVWRDMSGDVYRAVVMLEERALICNLPAITMSEDFTLSLNGEKTLSVKAQVKNNALFLPLRAIGEAMGCEVWWDDTLGACAQGTQFYGIRPDGGITCFVENGTTYVEATVLADGLGFDWG